MTWLVLSVAVVIVLAIVRPAVRESRLVRTGAVVLLVTAGLLALVPALVTGLLFFVLAPIALLMILLGTILGVGRGDKRVHEDVAALAAAARGTNRLWPDSPALPQVDRVAQSGLRAGPALVALLRFESAAQLSDETWSPNVEQQAALALCRIYGELPSGASTVYDTGATAEENSRVKRFWEARVRGRARP
jgi:hypothetical protein